MTEKLVQEGIQAVIRAMDEFGNADVRINDWDFLDGPISDAPYVMIENSDDFDSKQDTTSANTVWQIPVNLLERYVDWKQSMTDFRDRRQALIDKFNEVGSARAANGLASTTTDRIYPESPIGFRFLEYLDPELRDEQEPVFIEQRLLFQVEEF